MVTSDKLIFTFIKIMMTVNATINLKYPSSQIELFPIFGGFHFAEA